MLQTIPSFKFALLLILGILIGSVVKFPLWIIVASIFFLLLLHTYSHKKNKFPLINFFAICIVIILFGIYKSAIDFYVVPDNSVKHISNRKENFNVKLTGVITDLPQYDSNRIQFILESKSITVSNKSIEVSGDVMVTVWENTFTDREQIPPQLTYGEEVSLSGKISDAPGKRNPGEFDYKEYLAIQEIHKTMTVTGYRNVKIVSENNLDFFRQYILFPAKVFVLQNIDENINGPEASYLKSLVTGERGDISKEMKQSFIDAGVMHLIAVSGLNVAYIILTITLLLSLFRIPQYPRTIVTILFLVFYCLLTGSTASIVRATIMGILFLISFLMERKVNFYNVIGTSLIVILLYDAKQLFDPGFILSYSAVLSMSAFYYKFEKLFIHRINNRRIRHKKFIFYIMVLFFSTLAAQIGTLPVIAVYFEKISFISLLANMVAVPMANLSLAIGFSQVITGIFSNFLSSVIAQANSFLLSVQLLFIKWCASLDFAYVHLYKFSLLNIVSYYLILILVFTIKNVRQIFFRFMLSSVVIISAFLFTIDFNKRLKVSFLDVGQGDCAIIETPDDRVIVVDCGTSTFTYNSGERTIAPYLRRSGISKIDLIILTHLHNDHIGGINYLLDNFKIGKIIESGQNFQTSFISKMDSLIECKHVSRETIRSGYLIDALNNIRLYFLFPNDEFVSADGRTRDDNLNNGSVAFILKYKEIGFFFTGDIEHEAEEFLFRAYSDFLKTEVLKTAHHGSITSTTVPFIAKNQPDFAVMSCGKFNKFNHPSDSVLKRLEGIGAKIFRTDNDGAVLIESDGTSIEVIDWK